MKGRESDVEVPCIVTVKFWSWSSGVLFLHQVWLCMFTCDLSFGMFLECLMIKVRIKKQKTKPDSLPFCIGHA